MIKIICAILSLALLHGCLTGCVSQQAIDKDPLVVAKQAQALGFKVRLVVIFGPGHIGGLSYSATGANGFIELTLDPPTGAPE